MNSKPFLYIFFTGFIILYLFLHLDPLQEDLNGIHLWRQTETQTNIQNFYRYDYNILNPSCNIFNGNKGNIKRFEFPIMQWIIANFYFVFEDKIIITRALMFIFSAIGILGFVNLLWILTKNKITTVLGSIVFSFSPLYYFYSINPMPDVFSFICSIWYLYFLINYFETNKYYSLILSGILISLSILAKLPFVIYGVAPAFYVMSKLYKRFKNIRDPHIFNIIMVFSISLIPPIIWYSWVMPTWGTQTVIGGILNGDFDFKNYLTILKYHYNTMLPEYLLNKISFYLFVFSVALMIWKKGYQSKHYVLFATTGIATLIYFLYELNMIGVLHDYYMIPFLLPIYLIIAYGINEITKLHKYIVYLTIFIILIIPKTTYESTFEWWTNKKAGIPDEWVNDREKLRGIVPDNALCAMLNDYTNYVFPYVINKQGYCFQNDNLPIAWIEDMIKNYNVNYLYSTSRKVDEDSNFQKYIDKKLYDKGITRVFKIKMPSK